MSRRPSDQIDGGHKAELLRFLQAVSKLDDPRAIMNMAVEAVGRALRCNRSGYSELSDDGATMSFQVCWSDGQLEPLTGSIPTATAGQAALEVLRAGRTLIIERGDPAVASTPPAWRSMGTRASISVPLLRDAQYVASLWAHQAQDRSWTADEIAFVEDVAARTWDAVKRARAEEELRRLNATLTQQVDDQTRQLRDSEAQWRGLFTQMQEGLMICQVSRDDTQRVVDWAFLEVNPAWETLLGATRAQVIGLKIMQARPDEGMAWIEGVNRIFDTGAPARFAGEARLTGKFYEADAFKVDEDRFAVVFLDTTERRAADAALHLSEEHLREEQSRLATLIEHLPVGVCFVDHDGRALLSNPAYRRFEPDDLMPSRRENGPMRWKAWDADGKPLARDQYVGAQSLRGETVSGVEFLVQIDEAHAIWTRVSGVPIFDAKGDVAAALVVVDEIDEQKRAQDALESLNQTLEERVALRTSELQSAQEALRQAQKMEALGQLTGGIAHDFNNLLAGISGSLELLNKRIAEGRLNAADRYNETAQGAAKRAAALTHRLLAFARRQTLSPVVTDVEALIKGMEDLLRRSIGPEIEIEIDRGQNLWSALIDAHQFENALLNLCINARDAMPDGGRLTIRTSNERIDSALAASLDVPGGDYLALKVEDTGTGMAPDVIARAFDPFFTTKPTGQGTGLGLSMIYGFVRQSGGQVTIKSERGRGSTLTVYLPRHSGQVAARNVKAENLALTGGSSRTVLVVDDEPSVRMLMIEVMQDAGFNTLEAVDGASALKVLDTPGVIDLLISDVGLPGGLNGRQVADAARGGRPHLKVLLVTGYAEQNVLGAVELEAGMQVLTKPFTIGELSDRVRSLVETDLKPENLMT